MSAPDTAVDQAAHPATDGSDGSDPAEISNGAAEQGEDAPKKSVATVLVELARSRYDFCVNEAGEAFGVPKWGPKVTFLLRGGKKSLRAQLARDYFRLTGRAATQQGLADALLVLEGEAQEAEEEELHLRVAAHDGALWLDLGDQTGRAVKITGKGWRVKQRAPVLFRRTALAAPLPEPCRGGQLDDLKRWLNIDQDDWPLVYAWLVAALHPDIPHPALGLFGEQGTGKTTVAKVLVSLIDPSPVPARKPPRDADSWVTAAAGSWVVALDNLSDMSDWLSDSICRAVTGDGDVRRRLYTDGDLAVFAFRRCLILNGIDLGALRGDLADRLLHINLARIADDARLDEAAMWPAWWEAQPAILGALLDLAAEVVGVLPSVRLGSKPRMADFARIVAAVDQVLGTAGLGRYLDKQRSLAGDSLEGDEFVARLPHSFTGTAAQLLAAVTPTDEGWRRPKDWPRNPRAVTVLLRRQAPVMRKAGWTVEDDGARNKAGVARWTVTRPEMARDGSPPSPPSPPAQVGGREGSPPRQGTAGMAGNGNPALTSPGREAGIAGNEYGSSQDGHHPLPDPPGGTP